MTGASRALAARGRTEAGKRVRAGTGTGTGTGTEQVAPSASRFELPACYAPAFALARTQQVQWVAAIERVLGLSATRWILSVAIVISLVPHDWMHANDAWFLVLFVPEWVARVLVACRNDSSDGNATQGVGWRWPKLGAVMLLFIDLVAIASFLPLEGLLQQARWLRIFRLTRTVMLLRYWAPMLRDLWVVLRRRERARQLGMLGMIVIAVAFGGTVVLNHANHELAEDFDEDGIAGDPRDELFWQRMWWAVRQLEDPGNKLAAPNEGATVAVSIVLTVCGMFMISFLIGLGSNAVAELMELSKVRPSGLSRHTVLVNITPATRQLLYEVIGEYRKLMPAGLRPLTPRWFRELRANARHRRELVIVGRTNEPPEFMREPEFASIVYRYNTEADQDDEAFITRADIPVARRIVVLADLASPKPDDETIRTLLTIVERLRGAKASDGRAMLIAEILDESNIGAAQRAIARAGDRVDAHIVPTERLLALYVACVARRSGVHTLLQTMLASTDHEIYFYDYRTTEGRTDGSAAAPVVATPATEALEHLYWRGMERPPARRVLPVGVLMAPRDADRTVPARVVLNPTLADAHLESDETFVGFVALAHNMRVAEDFAREIADAPPRPAAKPTAPVDVPRMVPAPVNVLHKILILGFRPATVNLVEALVSAEARTEILVIVEDELERERALDAFEAHSNLVATGLLDAARGVFVPHSSGTGLACIPGHPGAKQSGHIRVATGDWTSSRQLMQLPCDFGNAALVDAVLMIANERTGSDARTTTALMKLEHIQGHVERQTGATVSQTVVVELVNSELARRVSERYAALGRTNVTAFSIHELRAYFMFQSVVVPHFNLVYGEFMAPWGQSLVRLDVVAPGEGTCTFAELANSLREPGQIPIAVIVRQEDGRRRLCVGQGDPEQDDTIDLSRLDAVWIIRTDAAPDEATGRHAAIAVTAPAPAT
jgi:hypothetical protein